MSFPGLLYETPRAFRAVAKGMNMHGEPVLIEGSELLARVLQHETDHLDGIVFIDRLSAENRKQAMRDIRESDWFNQNQVAGKQIQFKVSPHSTNGLGM